MGFWQEAWQGIVNEAPYMLRLLVACLCGAAIGVERSLRQKEAGIRTHIVVSLGAALAMVISKYAFFDVAGSAGLSADTSRVAAQIVSGVGFLGAGVIFARGATIRGLTTAAGIWTTAAIGMAIGAGMYPIGIVATALIVAIQLLLHKYLRLEKNITTDVDAVLSDTPAALTNFREQLEGRGMEVLSFEIRKSAPGEIHCLLTVKVREEGTLAVLEELMEENEALRSISV